MKISYEDIAHETIMKIQKHLKRLRETLGITAGRLGEIIGVSEQLINSFEDGEEKMNASQYLAFAAIMDSMIKEDTALLSIIRGIIEADYCDSTSDKEYSFVDEWLKLFSDKCDEIDYVLDNCKEIDESVFKLIAQNYNIFIDYDSITNENIGQVFQKYSGILKEEGNKIILPEIMLQMLKNSLESKDEEKINKTNEVLRVISMLYDEELIDIRGEKTDDSMNNILSKIYKMHGSVHRFFVITNNESTLKKINKLNEMDGLKIRSSYLTSDLELRIHNEEDEDIMLSYDNYDEDHEDNYDEDHEDNYDEDHEDNYDEDHEDDSDDNYEDDSDDDYEDDCDDDHEDDSDDDYEDDSDDDYEDDCDDDYEDDSDDDYEDDSDDDYEDDCDDDYEDDYEDDYYEHCDNEFKLHEDDEGIKEIFEKPRVHRGWDEML